MDTPHSDAHDGVATQPWRQVAVEHLARLQVDLLALEEVLQEHVSWPREPQDQHTAAANANVRLACRHIDTAIEYLQAS
jgi:hypothetical protein